MEDNRFYVPDNTDGYFHVYNRGVDKRIIFADRRDYLRFEETIKYYIKGPHELSLAQSKDCPNLDPTGLGINLKNRVRIIAYCLMRNHYHLLIKSIAHDGIIKFMSDLSNSYTRYFNIKHERSGRLFEGPFKRKQILDDPSLLQVSRYIHLNPIINPFQYRYSSLLQWTSPDNSHAFLDLKEISNWVKTTGGRQQYSDFVISKLENSSGTGIEDVIFDE